ncbi:MAG: serine/threonine protein kinase [Planctomycetota bacterium]|nr:MAG: serine/threonine protein kinase [Planctomycetota bacterium]REK18109.1 MAG: serine/threonine protein kinase [Planctomycetota bacterium]REK44222.1 MAG: serine/threonine protein kinase [Planctomycetota bacterium]
MIEPRREQDQKPSQGVDETTSPDQPEAQEPRLQDGFATVASAAGANPGKQDDNNPSSDSHAAEVEIQTVRSDDTPNAFAEDLDATSAYVSTASQDWPTTIPRFHCLQQLGKGAFGTVFKVYDPQLKVERAIKVANRAVLESGHVDVDTYLEEAQRLASLGAPGIVRLLDANRTDDGLVYLVMEFMPGGTLTQRIRQAKPGHEEVARLMAQVADTVAYLHKRGVVHRDLKPDNILFDEEGRPRIADFGLAMHDEEFGEGPKVCGTMKYMGPEQFGDASVVDGRADIYSLGVILYEALTGESPYRATTVEELKEEVQTVEPKPLRMIDETIHPELERICRKAMAKDLDERYSTAIDMARDLRRIRWHPKPWWHTLLKTAAAIVLAGIVLTLGIVTYRAFDPVNPDPIAPVQVDPDLVVHVQRAKDEGVYSVVMNERDMPLFSRDKIRIHAMNKDPVYFYLYWIDVHGQARRLWPPDERSLAEQTSMSELWSPSEPPKDGEYPWWEMKGEGGGHEIAFLGVSKEPLTPAQLRAFESRTFSVSRSIAEEVRLAEFENPAQGRKSIQRGLGSNPVFATTDVLIGIDSEADSLFDAYHGWAMYHGRGKPTGNSD